MKRIKTIFFWTFNILLIVGLLAISVVAYIKGDTYHTFLDLLYFLIILSNFCFRVWNRKLKQEKESYYEGGKVLVEQNAELTRKIQEMQNPFTPMEPVHLASIENVNIQHIKHAIRYEKDFLRGYDEMETNRRKYSLEIDAKNGLIDELLKTNAIDINYPDNSGEIGFVVAEIIVGIKESQDTHKIINS